MEKLGSIILYNTEDIRKLLHIGKGRAQGLFKKEEFPSIKAGGKNLIIEGKLIEYLSMKREI